MPIDCSAVGPDLSQIYMQTLQKSGMACGCVTINALTLI